MRNNDRKACLVGVRSERFSTTHLRGFLIFCTLAGRPTYRLYAACYIDGVAPLVPSAIGRDKALR